MRVRVEENVPEGNGGSLLQSGVARAKRMRDGLPAAASALKPFYRTASLPCPYLPGRTERKLIPETAAGDAATFYSELSRAGFRRSHHLAYRPACAGCQACLPVRVAAQEFEASRSLRRVANANRDLAISMLPARASAE